MDYEFKKKHEYNKRLIESTNIKQKYKDRIPIIVEKYKDSILPNIDKCKYLVPEDMSLGQFIYVIRKRIKLDADQSLFVTVNGVLGGSSTTISELYDSYKDDDGFLYVVYTSENTFG
jgi:GABA(A) receptor-associated protein